MLKKLLSILILSSIFVSTLFAQDVYTVYRLPEGKIVEVGTEEYMGYTVPQYKDLLQLDSDLRICDRDLVYYTQEKMLLEEKAADLQKTVVLTEEQLKVTEADRQRIYKEWTAENKDRHLAEEKPSFFTMPLIIASTVAVVEAGVIVLLVSINNR